MGRRKPTPKQTPDQLDKLLSDDEFALSSPVSAEQPKQERRKLTLYLDEDLLKLANAMEFTLKQELDSVNRAYNRNSIIEESLRLALAEYAEQGMTSQIVKQLQKRQ